MFDPVTAIVGAGVIGGGLSYLGASEQADAQQSAADAQAAQAAASGQQQWAMYQQNRADMLDWLNQGKLGLQY